MTPITAVLRQKQFSQSHQIAKLTTTASVIAVLENQTEQSTKVRRVVLVVSLAAARIKKSPRRKRRKRRRRKKRRRKMWSKIKSQARPSSDHRLHSCHIQHHFQHCINFIKCKTECLMER